MGNDGSARPPPYGGEGAGHFEGRMGQRTTTPFDDRPFFADAMERDLEAQLAAGYSLIQRQDDGVWVRRTKDGETVLPYRDDLGGTSVSNRG